MIPHLELDIWLVFKIISAIQCLFFCTLISTTKSENPRAQKFLVLCLLIFALLETDDLFFHSKYILQIPNWIGLVDPLAYCLGPLIYLYTSSLTNNSFTFRKLHLYYFIPVVALYFFWIPIFLKPSTIKIDYLLQIFNRDADILPVNYLHYLFFISAGLAIFFGFIFLALSYYKLYKFNVRIKDLFSDIHSINLKWLKFLLVLITFVWLSSFLNFFVNSKILDASDVVVFPVFIFLISYYDIRQKRIPFIIERTNVEDHRVPSEPIFSYLTDNEESIKYAKSGMNEIIFRELYDKLILLLNNEKVYIKNDLSLQDLAELMKTSTHNLSQLLNQKLNQSFYEFINFHRVQEVMRKIDSGKFNHLKILAIAFDSGFNSKTTFNTAFKKYAGISPTEYKKAGISVNIAQSIKL